MACGLPATKRSSDEPPSINLLTPPDPPEPSIAGKVQSVIYDTIRLRR
jgi:hypothetical protein